MPYIAPHSRTAYDTIVRDLYRDLTSTDWSDRVAALLFSVAFDVYGDANNTRYFKQNEVVGVFCAAALEAQRRFDSKILQPDQSRIEWKGGISKVVNPLRKVLALIPRDDETQRCGHLNYFATELTLAAAERGWLTTPEGPGCFLLRLADEWYRVVTGPYEDDAITKNGDTPGYTKLLGT
jgi:hypothetical protein